MAYQLWLKYLKMNYLNDNERFEREDPWQDIGYRGIDPEVSKKLGGRYSKDSLSNQNLSKEIIANAAKIALPRFPECQKGESISEREIKQRLSQIKAIGYHVDSYSNMRREEAWNYLSDLRAEIKAKARGLGLASLVLEIEQANSRKAREAKFLR